MGCDGPASRRAGGRTVRGTGKRVGDPEAWGRAYYDRPAVSTTPGADMNAKVRTFIATEIMLEDDASVVNDDTRLVGGVMDSLGLMQLVAFVQEEFGITFDETEVTPENFRTVSSVERLLGSKSRSR